MDEVATNFSGSGPCCYCLLEGETRFVRSSKGARVGWEIGGRCCQIWKRPAKARWGQPREFGSRVEEANSAFQFNDLGARFCYADLPRCEEARGEGILADVANSVIHLGETDEISTILRDAIRPDEHCGDDLEESGEIYVLEATAIFGRHTPPPDTTDWRAHRKSTLEILERSKDLTAMGHLLSAAIRTEPFGVVLDIIAAAGIWVKDHPENVYPLLDGDGIARANALGCLVDPLAIMSDLPKMVVVSSRTLGEFTVESAADSDTEQMREALQTAEEGQLSALSEKLDAALEAIRAFETPAEDDHPAPNLAVLTGFLESLNGVVSTAESVDDADQGNDGEKGGDSSSGGVAVPGQIGSREEAKVALAAVSAYFRRAEPSSPVPLLLDRAERLISKPFLDVLSELLPDSIDNANTTFGIKESDSYTDMEEDTDG